MTQIGATRHLCIGACQNRQRMAHASVNPQEILDRFDGFNVCRIELGSDPFAHREDHSWLLQQAYVDVVFSRR